MAWLKLYYHACGNWGQVRGCIFRVNLEFSISHFNSPETYEGAGPSGDFGGVVPDRLIMQSRILSLTRPAFIVAEPEPEQALSARKILLETFKYNVITAHSVSETLDLMRLFPNVNALIIHCGIPGFDADDLIPAVKKSAPDLPIIALTPTERDLKWADYVVRSHNPQELLDLVQRLFGDPRKNPALSQ